MNYSPNYILDVRLHTPNNGEIIAFSHEITPQDHKGVLNQINETDEAVFVMLGDISVKEANEKRKMRELYIKMISEMIGAGIVNHMLNNDTFNGYKPHE